VTQIFGSVSNFGWTQLPSTHKLNPNFKSSKKALPSKVSSLLGKPKQMVRPEPTTTCTADIDTNYLTTLTVLLVSQTQPYICKDVYSSNGKIVPVELLPLMTK